MFRRLASSLVLACATTLPACSGAPASYEVAVSNSTEASAWTLEGSPAISSSFMTPSAEGQQPVIDAINEAKSSIRMITSHLTNPAVVTALVAAQNRGVDVEMILDQANLADHTPASIVDPLKKAGIKVIASSTGFRITHIKSLVIDNAKALIMSINLDDGLRVPPMAITQTGASRSPSSRDGDRSEATCFLGVGLGVGGSLGG